MATLSRLRKKLQNVTLVNLVKRIPSKRTRDFLLPRLYYYFNTLPDLLILDITSKCNAACPFCPRTILEVRGTNMPDEIFYKAVDQACDLGIRKCRIYSTGEPLLHPHFDQFVKYLKDKNFYVMVSTNGQFADKHLESLSQVDWVKFSIEGWDKESYEFYRKNCDFPKVQNNLAEFKKYISGRKNRPVTVIALMVMRETKMDEFFKVWADKVDKILIYPTSNVFDWGGDDKIEFLNYDFSKRLKENMYSYVKTEGTKYCGYHFECVLISAQGNGVICCSDFTDSILYGNLRNVSLLDIINSPKRKAGQRQYVSQKFDVCDGCTEFDKLDDRSVTEYHTKVETYKARSNGGM